MIWRLTGPATGQWTRGGADPFTSLQRELNRVFDDMIGGVPVTAQTAAASATLRLDVKEDDKAFHVTADLPGMSEKDVDVSFHDGVLTIRGEKKLERDEKKDTWHITERSYGSFARQLAMPAKIDADTIGATFDKGVLTVTLPKMAEAQAKARKIEVRSGG